jgi:hypothetical protein
MDNHPVNIVKLRTDIIGSAINSEFSIVSDNLPSTSNNVPNTNSDTTAHSLNQCGRG